MTTHDDSRRGRGGARSLAELQALSQMNRSPAALRLESTDPVKLPSVAAPSLDGLSVVQAGPVAPLTEQDLVERFQALRRQHSDFRPRAAGEEVALEDDALLDVVGFVNDRVMPFSSREDWWARVAPDPLLPGFFEALVGVPVGRILRVELILPDTYVAEALRGQVARFVVEVKAARELTPLDEDSPRLLSRMGGGSLTDIMRGLAEDVARERAAEVERRTQERVMDVLVERTSVELPVSLVDEELRRLWAETERPVLLHKGFSPEGLQEALEGWLRDPLTRADVEYRLTLDLALRAIAERDGIQPDRASTEAMLEDLLKVTGVSRQDMGRAVKEDPALDRRLYDMAQRLRTLEHVMKHVTLRPPDGAAT
ncbi:MAG: peptidylprolyl isomerase [Myxococcaceae bacterium]|nr:MAG: peptidylprolyl isomerase [Myxococcaceae bacterium]